MKEQVIEKIREYAEYFILEAELDIDEIAKKSFLVNPRKDYRYELEQHIEKISDGFSGEYVNENELVDFQCDVEDQFVKFVKKELEF